MPALRLGRFTPRSMRKHEEAAREAVAICATADTMANEAMSCVGADEERLFELLERREEILATLAEHLVSLKLERPTADGPLLAATERAADAADALVAEVCEALNASNRATMALAARVANRVTELRGQLAAAQRAGSAHSAYASRPTTVHVDSRR